MASTLVSLMMPMTFFVLRLLLPLVQLCLCSGHELRSYVARPLPLKAPVDSPPLEVLPLITTGRPENRVDLTFFADGYLASERDKFFSDALRLAQDISQNQTYFNVRPLLNFWAAFTPSNFSGIGVDGPEDTPFGLCRFGTQLRGLFVANVDVARAARDSLGTRCDFPILLGNDAFYGGNNGEFTTVTASILNGPLVLRHELGHSLLDVGEEYDGADDYHGADAANSSSRDAIPWVQWLSDPSRVDAAGNPLVERSAMPMQDYPWTLLNTTKPWLVEFNSSGEYERYRVQFSLSGLPSKDDLRVTLDAEDLAWVPKNGIGQDRWFYNYLVDKGLASGNHVLKFELLKKELEGKAQVCSTEVLEYGNEDEFKAEPGFYSLYPTFSDVNHTTYRPSNEDCLMRQVTTPQICKVCMETLWINLLSKISLIDNLTESCDGSAKVLNLDLLPLAQLRETPVATKESYTIAWKKDAQTLEQFANQTRITVDGKQAPGNYSVDVLFWTEEVRKSAAALRNHVDYVVNNACSSA